MIPRHPLDRLASIKVKLGVLVGASIVAAATVLAIGSKAGVSGWVTLPVTIAVALLITQWLASGMTAPLREMTAAARRMSRGDYSRRVETSSADEVGTLAASFNRMAADLSEVDEQRRQLVATVSHELRTPLAAQRAVLENLVDGVVRPDDAVLQSALDQAERLSQLVDDLLDLSRIDGGAAALTLERLDVQELVTAAVREAEIASRTVTFETDIEPGLVVRGDGARLAQVVGNLLDNAARHSPTGGRVGIRAGRAGTDWTLTVTDQGGGIPPEERERVFERFGTTGGGGGTGLGLAIARWVCELHGGTVSALDPDPDETGARVVVRLPLNPQPRRPRTGEHAAYPPVLQQVTAQTRAHPPTAPVPLPPTTPPTAPTPQPDQTRTTMTATPAPQLHPTTAPGALPGASTPVGTVEGVFGSVWPERVSRPQPRRVLAAAAVGLLGAAVLPEGRMGLGVVLVLLAAAGVIGQASRAIRSRWGLATAAIGLPLLSLAAIRADEGIAMLGFVAAAALLATAVTDARSVQGMVASGLAWVLSGLRGLPLLGRSIRAMSRRTVFWAAVRTALVSAVLVIVFGALFASADAVFGSWAKALVPELRWASFTQRSFLWFLVGGVTLAGTYLALNPPPVEKVRLAPGRPVRHLWEWVVPLAGTVLVFAGFIAAQAAALFAGHDYVRRTTGMTYADYTHQGFGQLTVATTLTLLVVAVALRKAQLDHPQGRLVTRVVLGALCALTLLVVASALWRVGLYQAAYGFTTLRLLVIAFELWLGLVIAGLLVSGIRLRAAWLPRAALFSGAAIVLGLGLLNPQGWVASHNIERYHATGKIDAAYLARLGPDASPAVRDGRLPTDLTACVLARQAGDGAPRNLLEWSLSRSRVAPVAEPAGCDQLLLDADRR
ncbi:DUF4153 domain-containing protein [Actinomycetota bacterium]